jgi:hypothetical protein
MVGSCTWERTETGARFWLGKDTRNDTFPLPVVPCAKRTGRPA